MDRRAFLGTLGVLFPPVASAQQPPKIYRVAYLSIGSAVEAANRVTAMRAGLREYDWIEGKNIEFVFRWADPPGRLAELAADLVKLKVDVIFAPSSTEVDAARRATKTIPIVFANHADPVGVGHVASLARPGGNITGLSVLLTEIVPKQLELLKQALPHMKRIGALVVETAPSTRPALLSIESAAPRLGLQPLAVPVQTAEDLPAAFAMMARERVDGVLAVPTPLLRSHRVELAELSLKHRLPGMFGPRENVEAGGLMSYFADSVDLTRRAATYINKILRGTRPAELPVEQASKFELVINLKTAKALDLTIPPALLQRADQVIE